jgi:hypothetical protein
MARSRSVAKPMRQAVAHTASVSAAVAVVARACQIPVQTTLSRRVGAKLGREQLHKCLSGTGVAAVADRGDRVFWRRSSDEGG